jgi:hypothetical protein
MRKIENRLLDALILIDTLSGTGFIGVLKELSDGTIARAIKYEETYKPSYKEPSSPDLYAKGSTGYWTAEMSRTGKVT